MQMEKQTNKTQNHTRLEPSKTQETNKSESMNKAINLNNEEVEYPIEIIKCMDKYFPKGNKARGKALVLQAVSYLEGKKQGKLLGRNEVIEIIKKEQDRYSEGNYFKVFNVLKDLIKQIQDY